MRTRFRITMCLAVLLLGGCDMPMFTGITCLPFEPGDCGTTPVGIGGPAAYMIGFPPEKLERDTSGVSRGLLRVGDTVTFYVISATNFPHDTLRTVDWSADTTTARISVRSDDGLTLVATALGQVLVYTGSLGAVWNACSTVAGAFTCAPIDEIDVIP